MQTGAIQAAQFRNLVIISIRKRLLLKWSEFNHYSNKKAITIFRMVTASDSTDTEIQCLRYMVQISAVIVDADKTIASQMPSYKNYVQVSSEISLFTHPNGTISSVQIVQLVMIKMLSSAHCSGSILSVLCVTLSAF